MPFTSKMHKNQPVTGMHWDCFGFQGLHDVRLLEHVADYPTSILNLWPPSGLKHWSLGFKRQHPWVVPSTLATFRSLGFQAYGNLQEMLLQSCLGNPHSSRSSEEMVERSRDLVLFLGMTGLINFHYWGIGIYANHGVFWEATNSKQTKSDLCHWGTCSKPPGRLIVWFLPLEQRKVFSCWGSIIHGNLQQLVVAFSMRMKVIPVPLAWR